MCQFNWDMGCTDIWLNNILDVSVKACLDKINFWTDRLSKALFNVSGFIQSVGSMNRIKTIKREIPLFAWLSLSGISAFYL